MTQKRRRQGVRALGTGGKDRSTEEDGSVQIRARGGGGVCRKGLVGRTSYRIGGAVTGHDKVDSRIGDGRAGKVRKTPGGGFTEEEL